MSEKLQEATMKALTEDNSKFSIKNISEEKFNPFIVDYRVGKTGIRFTAVFNIDTNNYEKGYNDTLRMECHIEIKNNGEIIPKFEIASYEKYTINNIENLDDFVNEAIKAAVEEGYIEQKDGIYIDKKESEKNKAKSDFLNMVDKSDEELKSTLPGKTVQGLNSDHLWEVLGIFTAYNGKDYVAMKKKGMFNDPGLTELSRFKKSYKVID